MKNIDLSNAVGRIYPDDYINKIICGDCLEVMKDMPDKCVDLCYVDPPFFTQRKRKSSKKKYEFNDVWNSLKEYIEWMRDRVIKMYDVLKDTGSFYFHCDWHASHYLKVMIDEVFGYRNFQNEIIWHYYNIASSSKRLFARNHDTILWYSKENKKQTFNFEELRIPYEEGSSYAKRGWSKQSKYPPHPRGKIMDDVWRMPTINNMAKERLGYPTQKPEALLERIIKASSNKSDLVLDPFCGCGTAMAVSYRLKRKWIGMDISPTAISLANKILEKNKMIEKEILNVKEGISVPF